MLKEELSTFDLRNTNEGEGDYNIVFEILHNKIKMGYESRVNRFTKLFFEEMEQCAKVFRHSLKNLISNTGKEKTFYYGLAIDCIWKLMLLNIETLMEHENRVIKQTTEETIKNDELLRQSLEQGLSKLELRKKEIQLEYAIKKEQYNAKVKGLMDEKIELNNIIETNKMQIQDLMNPSRFVYMHHFLTEFKDKFEGSYESNIKRLRITQNMLHLMLKNDMEKELNDELSTVDMYFPKYTITILRGFQEQLKISKEELLRKWRKVGERIGEVLDGVFVDKELINASIQTDKLKELEEIDKVII